MNAPLNFLVVDTEDLMRSLVSRTLLRRFPDAIVQQCSSTEAALHATHADTISGVVVQRSKGTTPTDLIARLRAANPHVPIVLLSRSIDHHAATTAGADYLLDPDNWIRVSDILQALQESLPGPHGVSLPFEQTA